MNHYQVFNTSTDAAADRRRIRFCPQCGLPLAPAGSARGRQRCARCGYTAYLNPSPGVTVLIRDAEGRVLIGKRTAESDYGGKWCLPGGYIEYEESFLDATVREVREETGVTVRIEGIVNVVSNLLDDTHHTLVVVLLAQALEDCATPGDDVSEVRWVDKDGHEAVDYAFEADRRIIDVFFAGGMEVIPADERHPATGEGRISSLA